MKSIEFVDATSLRVGLVRLRRGEGESITDRYEFRTIDLTGKILARQVGSGRFLSRSQSLTACMADDLIPELRVYRADRAAAVCQ